MTEPETSAAVEATGQTGAPEIAPVGTTYMSLKAAAKIVLEREGKPMTPKAIYEAALEQNLVAPTRQGQTPTATLASGLYTDRSGVFAKAGPGRFGLAGMEIEDGSVRRTLAAGAGVATASKPRAARIPKSAPVSGMSWGTICPHCGKAIYETDFTPAAQIQEASQAAQAGAEVATQPESKQTYAEMLREQAQAIEAPSVESVIGKEALENIRNQGEPLAIGSEQAATEAVVQELAQPAGLTWEQVVAREEEKKGKPLAKKEKRALKAKFDAGEY